MALGWTISLVEVKGLTIRCRFGDTAAPARPGGRPSLPRPPGHNKEQGMEPLPKLDSVKQCYGCGRENYTDGTAPPTYSYMLESKDTPAYMKRYCPRCNASWGEAIWDGKDESENEEGESCP